MNFGGMDMNKLMQQAQRMQDEMKKQQDELAAKFFTGSAGGGAVTINISGAYKVDSVKISDDLVKSGDVEMIQDLILSAMNNALQQVDAASKSSLGALSGLKNFF